MTVVAFWGQELHPLRHSWVMMRMWRDFGGTLGSGDTVLQGHWWQRGDMEWLWWHLGSGDASLTAECGDRGDVKWLWWVALGVRSPPLKARW